ncbi:MAG TPA: hypothetical protein VGE52_13350 [Pirellulales bacterium]
MFPRFFQSLGMPADLASQLDRVEWHWRWPWALAIGLPLLVLAAIWIDRRQQASLPGASRRWRLTLTAARTTVLAILLFVLAGPTLTLDETLVRKPILAVLVDRSQSMELPANYESESNLAQLAAAYKLKGAHGDFLSPETRETLRDTPRIQFLYRLLLGPGEEFWESLGEKYEVRFYDFADGAERLEGDFSATDEEASSTLSAPTSGAKPLAEKATRIDAAVALAIDEAAGRSMAGIVLLSDGQDAGAGEPSPAAAIALTPPAPIFAVPIGSTLRFRDVSIVSLFAPTTVSRGDQITVSVVLESQGFAGRTVPVELWDDATRLDVDEVILRDGEQQPCELHFTPSTSGLKRLTVRTPSQPEEPKFLQANNTEVGAVRVVDDKLRVLLIDGQPRWDYRFLKNAMSRDHGLTGLKGPQPDRVLEAEVLQLPSEQRKTALPRDTKTLSQYHTIILGDATRELLDETFCESLKTAVLQHGVGLIIASGPRAMPHTLPPGLSEVLPVKVAAPLPGATAGLAAPTFAPFRWSITPAGSLVEPLRLSLDPEQNRAVWNDLPPFFWCAAVERPSPGATILAANRALDGPYGPLPLIASQQAGRGKVLFLGTDSTWLWRRNVGDRYFYKFWGQALRFVARTEAHEAGRTTLAVDPATVSPERPATIELFAYDSSGAPLKAERAPIRIESPNGLDAQGATVAALEALADPTTPGRFTATFTPFAAGEHLLAYTPADGRPTIETRLWVVDRADELRRPNVNLAALERWAARSPGGGIVAPPAFNELPSRLAGESRTVSRRVEAPLWDNWLLLALLAGVYCVEVALRRSLGGN